MKNCIILILLMPCIVKAQTNVVSDITINTVWDISGSPYIIMNSISVQDGVSLSIDPGVEIKFNGLYSLSVLGEISAIGTLADSIIMTSNLENPNPLDWDRILVLVEFLDGASLSDLVGLGDFLEEKLGCKVDVVSQRALREEIKPYVYEDLLAL
jgi:hypothetical protein